MVTPDDPDHGRRGSNHLPHPETVGGSAVGQLCLSDGHRRPG